MNARALDSRDWRILEALHTDARISIAALARKVNLSAPAVAARIRRLQDDGFILGFRAVLNYERLGAPIGCHVRLLASRATYREALAAIKLMPEVRACAHATGEACLQLSVIATDVGHLEDVLERLGKFGETQTSLILSHVVDERPLARAFWQGRKAREP
jgi:Lrp/AsnC family leucine-responsive transcriptional regulator